jgi:hypothetical protein
MKSNSEIANTKDIKHDNKAITINTLFRTIFFVSIFLMLKTAGEACR